MISGNQNDKSNKVRTEQELAASRLAAIVESSDDAIISKDLNGMITSWNKGAEKIFGYTAHEMVGTSIMQLIPADRHDEENQILAKIKRGANVEHFETRRQTKDGRLIDVSVTASPIKDATDRIIGVSKVARDITERNQTAAALREREEQLRLYAEHSPAAIAMFDRDMKYLVVSRRWIEAYHLDNRTIVGRSHYEVFPEIPQRWKDIHQRCLAGAIEKCDEDPLLRADGTTNWVHWEVRPWRKADGSIGGIIIFSEDITARKLAEAARQATESRYRTLFDYAPDGIVIADPQSYYLDANTNMCRMLGYTRDELIGLHASDIVAPAEISQIGQALNVIKVRSTYNREWKFRRKDGSFFMAEVIATVMPDGNLMGMIRDTTERKRAAEALAESQALYHSLVDQMPAGVFRKNAEGRYVFVNSYFCRIRNATPEQFLGKLPRELPPSEAQFISQAASHHAQIMQTGQPVEVVDEYHRADGQTLFFHVVKSPVFDSDGKVIGSQGVLFDITTHKYAEDEVRRLNMELEQRVIERTAQLEEANKELESFSYSVSHDLRAPLRAVNGFADIVLEEFGPQLPAQARTHLERIRNGGQRMGELIDDLLSFSRLGRQHMNSQSVDSAKLVRTVLDESSPQREGRTVEFKVGKLPACQGDPALLKQVWVNLISNAIKYTRGREPALIEIGCNRKDDENVYFVRDNGAGFDMQYAHKLFGVFQRLHRTDEFEGTGVGLAIVERIVQRHGGRIWAEAVEKRGATFYFTLPGEKKS